MSNPMKIITMPFLAILALASYLVPPHITPWNYPADDSFFYLQVASHLGDGHGTTFNQITRTNGYHPLWMIFCVLSDVIAGGNRDLVLRVAIGLQQMMAMASAWMLYRVTKMLGFSSAFMILPLLCFFFMTRIYLSEAYLNLFFSTATLWTGASILVRPNRNATTHFAGLGALAGLMILSRLDNIFTGAAIVFMVLVYEAKAGGRGIFSRTTILNAVAAGLATLLVLAPYLALNFSLFGHFMPISGAIKNAAGGGLGFHLRGVSPMGWLFAIFILPGLAIAITRKAEFPARGILAGLACGYTLLLAYIVFLTRHHTNWPWYYTGGAILAALTSVLLMDILSKTRPFRCIKARHWIAMSLALCCMMNLYASLRFLYPGLVYGEGSLRDRLSFTSRWQQDVGNWLKNELPPHARIVIYDWPGIIAYASERVILAPDGLMNDFVYNDDLLRVGIRDYLEMNNIAYWLGPCKPGTTFDQYWYDVRYSPGFNEVEIISPLYKTSSGTFRVNDKDLVVRFRSVLPHPELPDLALWRIADQ